MFALQIRGRMVMVNTEVFRLNSGAHAKSPYARGLLPHPFNYQDNAS